MRYFFLAYALIALLVVGIFGFRGQKFSKPPIRIFPDMDEQDKAEGPEAGSRFSPTAMARRLPVAQTQPRGFNPDRRAVASAASPNMNSAARPVIITPAMSAITSAPACRRN